MLRLSFQRFFGLPRLRTPCGRLSLAIFARRLSSILSTWASHSLLQSFVHLIMSEFRLSVEVGHYGIVYHKGINTISNYADSFLRGVFWKQSHPEYKLDELSA